MLLEYGGIAYVDESVSDYFGCGWKDAKPMAPFGQLPLLVVDDEVIAQSGSIVRYCASLTDLLPADAIARAKCDMIYEAAAELTTSGAPCNVNPIVNIFKGDDWQAKKEAYFAVAPPKIANLERQYASSSGPFFLGAQAAYCDLGVYHGLSNTLLLEPTALDAHPSLRKMMAAVEELPRIKEYLAARPTPVDIGTAPMLRPNVVGTRAREVGVREVDSMERVVASLGKKQ